jgi:penicillin G amidase
VAGLGVLAGLALRSFIRAPLPPRSKTIETPLVKSPIEIRRDRWGIPHIYAQHTTDLYFGLGFVHAQDRLWQIDLLRRVANGTLSEVFGERTLDLDRVSRRLGFARRAADVSRTLPEETALALRQYAAGVTFEIDGRKRPLPVEFSLLRHSPDPWQVADTLAWSSLLAWNLTFGWDGEMIRARLLNRVSPDLLAMLEPTAYPIDSLRSLFGQTVAKEDGNNYDELASRFAQANQQFPGWVGGGSNSWAISGQHSSTGAPLLASDPHLRQSTPSIWYEAHLVGPEFDVIGATIPGTPGVIIGHNGAIAWGITAAMTDCQDLYAERTDPADAGAYAVGDEWHRFNTFDESIAVRGRSEPVVERVRVGRHGPVLIDESGSQPALAISSTVLVLGENVTSGIGLTRARNWQGFREALAGWTAPPLNFVYADRAGNIGHQLAGLHPRRRAADAMLPQPGWPTDAGWPGYRSFDELPSTYNPTSGIVVSANNQTAPDDEYGYGWATPLRATRIRQLLDANGPHSIASFRRIQLDTYALAADNVIRRATGITASTDLERQALDFLTTWDRRLTADSIGATIYSFLRVHLVRHLVIPVLGQQTPQFLGASIFPLAPTSTIAWRMTNFLLRALDREDWPEHFGGRPGDTWDGLMTRAFRVVVADLRHRLGDDASKWQWGRVHRAEFSHSLARVPILGGLLSRGPISIGGDSDSVLQAHVSLLDPGARPLWIPSYRQIVDLADLDNSVAIHAPGQSGQIGSPHFDDLLGPFAAGEYRPMLYSRGMVERETAGVIQIRPVP